MSSKKKDEGRSSRHRFRKVSIWFRHLNVAKKVALVGIAMNTTIVTGAITVTDMLAFGVRPGTDNPGTLTWHA
jgi:hypothetical protein